MDAIRATITRVHGSSVGNKGEEGDVLPPQHRQHATRDLRPGDLAARMEKKHLHARGKVKQWEVRWFHLACQEGTLAYFVDEEASGCKRVYTLSEYTVKVAVAPASKGYAFSLTHDSEGLQLVCAVETPEEHREWILGLVRAGCNGSMLGRSFNANSTYDGGRRSSAMPITLAASCGPDPPEEEVDELPEQHRQHTLSDLRPGDLAARMKKKHLHARGRIKQWEERWFHLSGEAGTLAYFEDERSDGCKRMYDLPQFSVKVAVIAAGHGFAFSLVSNGDGKDKLICALPTLEEQRKWILALVSAGCDGSKLGRSFSVESSSSRESSLNSQPADWPADFDAEEEEVESASDANRDTRYKYCSTPSKRSTMRVLFVGFGNVNKALARMLVEKGLVVDEHENEDLLLRVEVAGVLTRRHRCVVAEPGEKVDLREVLAALERGESLGGECTTAAAHARVFPDDAETEPSVAEIVDAIERCDCDAVFEATPVNYETGEPAVSFLRAALRTGKHALTANKGPVVHAHSELTALAAANGRRFFFESAVMDGIPVFSLHRFALPMCRVVSLCGLLNSTTNIILSRMEDGESFDAALKAAQDAGIAEADPAGDIDGHDAAVKVCALARVLMGDAALQLGDIDTSGIRDITQGSVEEAKASGKRWKLLCGVDGGETGETRRAWVRPVCVDASHPFYNLGGASSALTITSDVMAPVTIVSHEPTTQDTAYGLFADLLNCHRRVGDLAFA